MRVLIAEDENVSRHMLSSMLCKVGYEVVVASNGREAWDLLLQPGAPKVALIDWMMPEIDGVELCRRVRADESLAGVYMILVTGRSEKNDIVEGLDAGANDYVTKPYDPAELRARIGVGERITTLECSLKERIEELKAAISHIKSLQGIIPICMHCHSIRQDQESWQRLESYFQEHSDAQFSHGICPACWAKHYPDIPRD